MKDIFFLNTNSIYLGHAIDVDNIGTVNSFALVTIFIFVGNSVQFLPFSRERPPPASNDVTESTPIHPKGETIRDRSSRLSTILPHAAMGPPAAIPRDRRLDFMPKGPVVVEPEIFEFHSFEQRSVFRPEDLSDKFDCPVRRETFVKSAVPSEPSWTPQKLAEEPPPRNKWDRASGSADFRPAIAVPSQSQLHEEELSACMHDIDKDCSLELGSFALSPPRGGAGGEDGEKTVAAVQSADETAFGVPKIVVQLPVAEPLDLIAKTTDCKQLSIYQPEVSDIR